MRQERPRNHERSGLDPRPAPVPVPVAVPESAVGQEPSAARAARTRESALGDQPAVPGPACDLLEPDIPHSGGPIEIRRIAELAEMYHMSIAPHNMASAIRMTPTLVVD